MFMLRRVNNVITHLMPRSVAFENYRPLFITVVGMHMDLEVHSHTQGIYAA